MPRLGARLLETPGGLSFQERLQDDLAARHCVLLMVPTTVPPDTITAVIYEQRRQAFYIHEVELPSLSPHDPAAALGQYLEEHFDLQTSPRTLSALIQTAHLPEVLHLSKFEELDASAQTAWLDFVRDWAKYSPSLITQMGRPTALCLPVQTANLKIQPPTPELCLKVRWWWGIPSALDMRLLCRMEHLGTEDLMLSQWRESLLMSLAGTDTEFAEYLWDKLELPFEDFIPVCQEYAQLRGWTPEGLHRWNCLDVLTHSLQDSNRHGSQPDPMHKESWANGAVCYTPELGLQVHTAAVVMLERHDILRHRIWQGQVSLILPLLELLRIQVCQLLTDLYGSGWPTRWQVPQTDWEREAAVCFPSVCELGHLNTLLHLPKLSSERRFLPVVKQASWMRNEMAHGKSVTYGEYDRLRSLIPPT